MAVSSAWDVRQKHAANRVDAKAFLQHLFLVTQITLKQDKGRRVGAKRKATRTAGQLLSMLSLPRFTELCGTNPEGVEAARKLHNVRATRQFIFVDGIEGDLWD